MALEQLLVRGLRAVAFKDHKFALLQMFVLCATLCHYYCHARFLSHYLGDDFTRGRGETVLIFMDQTNTGSDGTIGLETSLSIPLSNSTHYHNVHSSLLSHQTTF